MLIFKFVYICLQNNNFVQHNSIWKIIVINVKSIKSRIQILYILYIFSYHFFQKMILFFFAILYYIQGEIKFNCSDKSMWSRFWRFTQIRVEARHRAWHTTCIPVGTDRRMRFFQAKVDTHALKFNLAGPI